MLPDIASMAQNKNSGSLQMPDQGQNQLISNSGTQIYSTGNLKIYKI